MSEFLVGLIIVVIIVLVLLAASVRRSVEQAAFITSATALMVLLIYKVKRSGGVSSETIKPGVMTFEVPFTPVVSLQRFEGPLAHRGEGNKYDMDCRFYDGESVASLYGLMGGAGDNRLAARSVWQGTQAKRAQDARSRYTKANLSRWFEDGELDMQEKRVWWEDCAESQLPL